MNRKLASIQRIKALEPVITRTGEEALRLRLATFEDVAWQCVVGAEQFTVGDLCVYIEVSSIVPETSDFEFMRKDKFIVKTKRFVGTTLSQGLAMPFSILPKGTYGYLEDVSELLGVKRYEPLETFGTASEQAGLFPDYIVPKTDEIRIQSSPLYLDLLRGKKVTATMKIHGTSSTFWFADGVLHVASRNFEVRDNGNVYWHIAHKYELEKKLAAYNWWVLQGEIAGPGICDNYLGLRSPQFFAFNIWDMRKAQYVCQDDFETFCRMIDVPHVPVVKRWENFDETIDSLLALADQKYDSGKPMEGLVLRPTWETLYDARVGRVSCKVINNQFLLKGNEA